MSIIHIFRSAYLSLLRFLIRLALAWRGVWAFVEGTLAELLELVKSGLNVLLCFAPNMLKDSGTTLGNLVWRHYKWMTGFNQEGKTTYEMRQHFREIGAAGVPTEESIAHRRLNDGFTYYF